jgi:16S rRNA (guanine527-N7)-methyltransferase
MSAEPAALRLRQLAGQYGLSGGQLGQLERLLWLLASGRHAPTSVRCPERAVEVHIADSLVALELEPVRVARAIADVGSGPGFPGLPLAVALRASLVHLVESQRRKCLFLERAIAELGLENARLVCQRAEQWSAGLGASDVVVGRAVGPQPVVVEYAAPLLRRGGVLVDWRGRRAPGEERQAARAAEQLGMRLTEIRHVVPFSGARDRHLHLYLKVSETPSGFPRRPGVASRRPLGGGAAGRGSVPHAG